MKTLSDILWNGDELVNPQEEGLPEIQYANENVVLIATHDSIGGEIATQIIDINDMENQGELKD